MEKEHFDELGSQATENERVVLDDPNQDLIDFDYSLIEDDDFHKTAPIRMPKKEDLTVQLVNVSLLARLDEAREDAQLIQNIFFAVIGAILGMVTGLFTSEMGFSSFKAPAWILLVVLVLTGGGLWGFMNRFDKRSKELKAKLYNEK